jgi:hypothetical protein
MCVRPRVLPWCAHHSWSQYPFEYTDGYRSAFAGARPEGHRRAVRLLWLRHHSSSLSLALALAVRR